MHTLTTDNYNKYYYLVLRLDENTLINLNTGVLNGVTCISDSHKSAFSYIRYLDELHFSKGNQ